MKVNLGSVLTIATRALGAIVTGVPVLQAAAATFKAGTGAEKKAALLEVVKAELAAAELVAGRDLANDPDVVAAAAAVVDAVAAFHKLIGRKAIGASA